MSDDVESPGSPSEAPRRSGRRAVVLLVGAAVAVAAVALVILWVNRDDEDTATDSTDDASSEDADGDPVAVVQRYFQAAADRDCETLIGLVSERTWEETDLADADEALANCRDAAETGQQLEGMTLERIGEVSEDGDAATVEVIGTYEGEPITDTFTLVREDGTWKLLLTP
jgi:putative lumazine-binding protein